MRRYYERPEQPQQAATHRAGPGRAADAAAGPARARLPRQGRARSDRRPRCCADSASRSTSSSTGSTPPARPRRLARRDLGERDGRRRRTPTWRCCRRGARPWRSTTRSSPPGRATPGWAEPCRSATTSGSCSTPTRTPPGSSSTSTRATWRGSTPARPTATRPPPRRARCARPGSRSRAATGPTSCGPGCSRPRPLAADDGTRELLLDDLVRGIRVEVWDDVTTQWHSLHRRRVTVTGEPGAVADPRRRARRRVPAAVGPQPARPSDATIGYYLHEVVAGWDGWSLSAPRPGLTIVHVEPPGPDGQTESVVETPPDAADRRGARDLAGRAALAAAAAVRHVVQLPGARRRPGRQLGAAGVPPRGRAGARTSATSQRRKQHLERLRDEVRALGIAQVSSRAPARCGDRAPARRHRRGRRRSAARRAAVRRRANSTRPGRPGGAEPAPTRGPARRAACPRRRRRRGPDPRRGARDPARAAAAADRRRRVRGTGRNDDLAAARRRNGCRPGRSSPRRGPTCGGSRSRHRRSSPRQELGTGEQPAALVVRSGIPDGAPVPTPGRPPSDTSHRRRPPSSRPRPPGSSTPPSAPATPPRSVGCTRSLWPSAARCWTSSCPASPTPRATDEQPGIALVDRPGADTGSPHRATLADITADRGRPIGEGQYVVHDTDALRLPYLPDPYATGVSLVFYEAGSPHLLPEPRALQAVVGAVPGGRGRRCSRCGSWSSAASELRRPGRRARGPRDGAAGRAGARRGLEHPRRRDAGEVRPVALAPGERRRPRRRLHRPTRWSPRRPSCARRRRAGPGGSRPRRTSASCTPCPRRCGRRAARRSASFLRPPGRAVAALTGLVDVHGSSTDTLVVARAAGPSRSTTCRHRPRRRSSKSDVVVRSPVGERRAHRRAVPLRLPADRSARARRWAASASTRCCRRSRTPTTGG